MKQHFKLLLPLPHSPVKKTSEVLSTMLSHVSLLYFYFIFHTNTGRGFRLLLLYKVLDILPD
jgi:hypothetical protein